MNTNKKKRTFIAWMLLMALLPFFVVKAFHHHEGGGMAVCSHAGQAHHSADDCAICQFSLSFFTEAQSIDFHCILTPVAFERVAYQDKRVYALSYSHPLRAPPAI